MIENELKMDTSSYPQICYFELWSQDCERETNNSVEMKRNTITLKEGGLPWQFRIIQSMAVMNLTLEENTFTNIG